MKLFLHHLLAATVLVSVSCTFSYAQEPDSSRNEKPRIGRMPSFQGGDINAFARWISERVTYPAALLNKGVTGRVVVKFIIEKNGTLTFHQIMESPDTLMSREVVLLALRAPRWEPARLENGEPARCYIVLPVNFVIPNPRKDKKLLPQIRQGQHVY